MENGAFFSDLQFKSLYDDFPVGNNVTDIDTENYRWSKEDIVEYIGIYDDPKMMITCNLDTSLEKDYVLMNFYHDFLWNNFIDNACFHVDIANIRGHECQQGTVSVASTAGSAHFHIDSDNCECDCCQWNNGSISDEDNFGFYINPNRDFSCSLDQSSTTNYWIGTILSNNDIIETTPFYTTQIQTTLFPTNIPTELPTNEPTTEPTIVPTIEPTDHPIDTIMPETTLIVGNTGSDLTTLTSNKKEEAIALVIVILIIIFLLGCACLIVKRKKHNQELSMIYFCK